MVIDEIKKNFKHFLVPYRNLVIDESLMLWKGRLLFKQFSKAKCHRFGIKLFVLCDVQTDFILDFIIYTGDSTKLLNCDPNLGKSGAVVMTMMKPYLNKGHHLFIDNWYSSPSLAMSLYKKKTHVTGTVRSNRRGMPKFSKKLKAGEMEQKYTKRMLTTKWHDRRDIHMLTTYFDDTMGDTGKIDFTKNKVYKPASVIGYNASMGTVDKTDMLLSSVECL